MNFIMNYFIRVDNFAEIIDISLLVKNLIFNLNLERYEILLSSGLIEIMAEKMRIMCEENKNIFMVFELFEELLSIGEKYKKTNYENRNKVKEKLEVIGLEKFFENNIGNKFKEISNICENIFDKYFNNN